MIALSYMSRDIWIPDGGEKWLLLWCDARIQEMSGQYFSHLNKIGMVPGGFPVVIRPKKRTYIEERYQHNLRESISVLFFLLIPPLFEISWQELKRGHRVFQSLSNCARWHLVASGVFLSWISCVSPVVPGLIRFLTAFWSGSRYPSPLLTAGYPSCSVCGVSGLFP